MRVVLVWRVCERVRAGVHVRAWGQLRCTYHPAGLPSSGGLIIPSGWHPELQQSGLSVLPQHRPEEERVGVWTSGRRMCVRASMGVVPAWPRHHSAALALCTRAHTHTRTLHTQAHVPVGSHGLAPLVGPCVLLPGQAAHTDTN